MKRLFALLAALALHLSPASAQTYPSPRFTGLTVDNLPVFAACNGVMIGAGAGAISCPETVPLGKLPTLPSSKISGLPSLTVTDAAIAMAADGSDNAGKVAALMSAITTSPTAYVGYPVHFPPNFGASRTVYYFADALRVSRPANINCGNTLARAAGVVLAFAPGVDGIVYEDNATSVDGGYSSGTLDGCAVWSLGRGQGVMAAGSQTVSSVSMTSVGSIAATTWTAGDGIIAWPRFNRTVSLTGSVSNGSGGRGATLNVTAIASGKLKVGDGIHATGIPSGAIISALGTGAGGVGTYTLSYPGLVAAGSTISADLFQTAPMVAPGAFVSAVSGSTLTLDSAFAPDADAITRQGNGNVYLYRLPAALVYSITTTAGSTSVTVTAGPKKLLPGDAIWTDAFPFGAVVLTATGVTTPTDRATPGAQTITVTDYIATDPIAASVTHAAGSGKLWLIPAGEKRRTSAHAHKTYVYGFPFGLQAVCQTRMSPALNCTAMRDYENAYEATIVGRWIGGNNTGASLSSGSIYILNSLTDIYEGGTVGSKYLGDNSNSAEAGTAPYGVMAYCGSQNVSSFDGMYIGYHTAPGCVGPLGLMGPTAVSGALSAPTVSAPQSSWPMDFQAFASLQLTGRHRFGWQSGGPSITLDSTPSAAQSMSWASDPYSTPKVFGMRFNWTNNSWESGPADAPTKPRLRWMEAGYTGRNHPDGDKGLGFPTGFMLGPEGQEVYVGAPASSAAGAKFVVPSGNGSSGQVLTSDGAGNTSWTTVASGGLTGFRNRLRNGQFLVNQRAVSGTVTLAAGAYGHDGVKGGAGGATYTFAQSGVDVTITISAGSLILPIEANMIEGGTFRLSHAGTAQARVWQGTGTTGSGSYAAAPFTTASLTANTQTNVEFSTGTIIRPQLEPGSAETAFERRPLASELAFCQRYYYRLSAGGSTTAIIGMLSADSGNQAWGKLIDLPVELRADGGTVGFSDPSHIGVWNAAGSAVYTATSIAGAGANKRSIYIGGGFNTSGASFTAGQALVLMFRNAGGWIDVSTEI